MILLSSIYPRELNIYAHTKSVEEYIFIYIYLYLYVYIYSYIYMHVYINIYIYIYVHTHQVSSVVSDSL